MYSKHAGGAFRIVVRSVSIIGSEQTFAEFKAVIFTKRQPSATSLAPVTAVEAATTQTRVCTAMCPYTHCCHVGDSFHVGFIPFLLRGNLKRAVWRDVRAPYETLILAEIPASGKQPVTLCFPQETEMLFSKSISCCLIPRPGLLSRGRCGETSGSS